MEMNMIISLQVQASHDSVTLHSKREMPAKTDGSENDLKLANSSKKDSINFVQKREMPTLTDGDE